MALNNATRKNVYSANGITTAFPYTFRILKNADMKVMVVALDGSDSILEINTHYTVTGADSAEGGTVSFITAPANDETVILYRDVEITQELDLVNNDPFDAELIEKAFDKGAMINQEQAEDISRALRLHISADDSISTELPVPLGGAGIGWSLDGLSLVNNPSGYQSAVNASQSAQAASETARDFAKEWASNPINLLVDDGVNDPAYSAYHYAEAASSASSTAQSYALQALSAVSTFDGSIYAVKADTYTKAEVDGILTADVLWAEDRKAIGTNGGDALSSANGYVKRTLNYEKQNEISGASFNTSTSQITLPAGTYEINCNAVAGNGVNNHQLRWYNATDAETVITGLSGNAPAGSSSNAEASGRFTITGTKVFELQHLTQTATALIGLGSGGVAPSPYNLFAKVIIRKVG